MSAVLAVLKAKPKSSVSVLTDGNVALTAFIPNDGAFIKLVQAFTGKSSTTDAAAFKAVAGLVEVLQGCRTLPYCKVLARQKCDLST